MTTWTQVKYLATCLLVLSGQLQQAAAQTGQTSTFTQISAYSRSIDALNEQYAAQLTTKTNLITERDAILKAIADSETELQSVNERIVLSQLALLGTEFELASSTQALQQFKSPEAVQQALGDAPSAHLFRYKRDSVAVRRMLLDANAAGRESESLQLDVASQSIVELQQKLLSSARDVTLRTEAWVRADRKLFDQYLELADKAGTRSRLELRAALRVLQQATSENPGASLAKAITLLRLDRPRDAAQLLESLMQQSAAVRALALAVRGELLAREGDVAGAKKALKQAAGLAPENSIVRWFRAQSLQILKEPEAALVEWQRLLKAGQHEIAAHRGLALTCCTFPSSNSRNRKLALEHAKLAHSLAGEQDWSCQIALALATAGEGDLPAAEALAEAAAENAMAERRQQCLEIAEQLEAGQIPVWKF